MRPIARYSLLAAFVVGLTSFGACVGEDKDFATDTASFAKKNCPNPGHKKCPEPPGEPVEPDFPATTLDAMRSPLRMALTPAGRLLVSDPRARKVFTVDPVSRLPDGALQIDGQPFAVGYLDGEVYVGNKKTRTIEVYSAAGGYRRSFVNGAVEHPMDMDVDPGSGLIYVVDNGTQTVKVFDAQGDLTLEFGALELVNPIGIAVSTSAGEVYVTDYGTDGGAAFIRVFDLTGGFVTAISGEGSCGMLGCSGGYSTPQSIDVDEAGVLYFADALLAEIVVFDRPAGSEVTRLGGRNTGIPALRIPAGVAVNGAGDVFVASSRTGTVAVFEGGAP